MHRGLPRWFDPTVIVLLLASITHAARRDYVDLVSFLLVAAAIVVERLTHRPLRPPATLHPITGARAALVAAGLVVYGVVAGSGEHAGPAVRLAVCLPGVVAFALVLTHPAAPSSSTGVGRGWVPWTIVLLLLAIWELTNFLLQPDALTDNPDHPTLSTVINPLLSDGAVRVVVLGLWLAAGVWLTRRALCGGGAPSRAAAATVPEGLPPTASEAP